MKLRFLSPCRGAGGFTMIELVVATMFLMVFISLVSNMIMSGNAAHKYANRLGRVTEISQQIVDDLKREMGSSVRLFGNDAEGLAYKAVIQPWPGVTRIASSRLPTIRPLDRFGKDTVGNEKSGNELMFVRHAWADTFTCTSGETYRVDIYRMVGYFMKAEGGGPSSRNPWGLNLSKWTSEPLIDASHIDGITDIDDRTETLYHLIHRTPDDDGEEHASATVVWMVGGDPTISGTFRQVLGDGSLSLTTEPPRSSIWRIERAPEFSVAGLLFYRHHSIASNYAQANRGMSRFAIRNDATNSVGFPHGLEFQIVGAPGSRKILLHMTTVSTNGTGMRAYYDAQVIMNMREG